MTPPLSPLLLDLLACPRCHGALRVDRDRLRCACGAEFAVVGGIPRLADGAGARDPKVAAELEAQKHAHRLYVDRRSVLNHWEEHALPRLAAELRDGDVRSSTWAAGSATSGGRGPPPVGGRRWLASIWSESCSRDVTAGYVGLVEGDVHRLPLRDGGFGAVVVGNALHHVADPAGALREVRRALRPGGVVIADEPRELAPLELVKKAVRRGNDAFGEHHRAFRPAECRRLFTDAGLEITRFAAVDAVGPLIAAALDLVRVGRLGVAAPVARALVRFDTAIARADPTGRVGLMLFARARKTAPSAH